MQKQFTNSELKKTVYRPAAGIGERFKEFRMFIGKSRNRLAQEFNWTTDVIRKIEEGRVPPPLVYLSQLANTYNLDINWLISGIPISHEIGERKGAPPPHLLKQLCKERHIRLKETYDDLLETLQVPEAAERLMVELDYYKRVFKDEIEQFLKKQQRIELSCA